MLATTVKAPHTYSKEIKSRLAQAQIETDEFMLSEFELDPNLSSFDSSRVSFVHYPGLTSFFNALSTFHPLQVPSKSLNRNFRSPSFDKSELNLYDNELPRKTSREED